MLNRTYIFDIENKMKVHIMLNAGGMGDILHAIPAVKVIAKQYPWQHYYIWVPDYLEALFKKALPGMRVGPFNKAPKKADGKKEGIIGFDTGRHSSMRVHLTDFAFYILMDRLPKSGEERNFSTINPKVSIKRFKLPENYVVISPYFRVTLRQITNGDLNIINNYLKEKNITPVLLGSSKQVFNSATGVNTNGVRAWKAPENAIDLCEKTSILEALQVIWGAKALVTMDGGLMHLACMSKTPVVAGFTSVDPVTRIPYKYGKLTDQIKVIEPDVDCRYCQSTWCMTYKGQHEFDSCFYEDHQCVRDMQGSKFVSKLKEILG